MMINGNRKFNEFVARCDGLQNSPPNNLLPLATPKNDTPTFEPSRRTESISELPTKSSVADVGSSSHCNTHPRSGDWECASFPLLPMNMKQPVIDSTVEHDTSSFQLLHSDRLATLVHAAWALVVGRMINSEGVVFGIANSVAVDAPAPLHVRLIGDQKISDYIMEVELQEMKAKPYVLNGSSNEALDFTTVLVMRTQEEVTEVGSVIESGVHHNHSLVVEVHHYTEKAKFIARFDSIVIQSWVVEKLLERLELVLCQINNADPKLNVADITIVTPQDQEQIWEWNDTVPEPIQQCVHEVIEEQSKLQANSPAICAWDGDLTYSELDGLAAKLAVQLIKLGIGPEMLVALCFEKSMWTSVAILGVLKAGGAFVLLDSSLPQQRLETIVEQAKSTLILTSVSLQTLSSRLVKKTVIVNSRLFAVPESHNDNKMCGSRATPSSAVYAVFTSGSTGVPKGIIITHSNMSSALILQKPILRLSTDTRMYDFISYSFSLAIMQFFATMASGGCFCVPSDQDRKNNFIGSFASLKANTVLLTPSIAEILSPEKLPGLQRIGFGGEKVRLKDIMPWWGRVEVISGYGSSECTTFNVINTNAPTTEHATRLGTGAGLRTWVVDPENHNCLLPPGCIGELILEGPLVSRGYLNNPTKTAEVFIKDPTWLSRGTPSHAGRSGRLYRTGDLVWQNNDGTLDIVGRKDVQVKIRGQRVELGDVEHWVQKCVPDASQVVAEVITPKDRESSPVLAAFILLGSNKVPTDNDDDAALPKVIPVSNDIRASLSQHLPSYMVPTVFFSILEIPMTATGKAHRKQLRDIGSSFSIEQLLDLQSTGGVSSQPTSKTELQLQSIWSRVLKLDTATIGLHDSFLRLGGDSIAAMKIVSEARKLGIALTISDMFQFPSIRLMAKQSHTVSNATEDILPFALLGDGTDPELVRSEISELYQLKSSAIKDIYPCTPLQEGIVSLGSKKPGDYVMQTTLKLPDSIAIEKFQAAWEAAVSTLTILRTRIVQHNTIGLLQVVLDEVITWNEAIGLDDYLQADRKRPMDLGKTLVRFALINEGNSPARWFVWTIHHALYDGWSLFLILDVVNRLYHDKPVEQGSQFQKFIDFINQRDKKKTTDYWLQALDQCHCEPFPALPRGIEQPVADTVLELSLSRPRRERLEATESTMIRAAWALVQGRMTNTKDVVFGATVSGRNAPIPHMDKMVGPTIATVPLRIIIDGGQTIHDYIENVQKQSMEMIPFEQIGLQKITKLSDCASQATTFQTLLIVQPQETGHASGIFETLQYGNQEQWFNTYALMLEAILGPEKIVIKATFDSRVIDSWTVHRLLERFEYVMEELDNFSSDRLLDDIDVLTSNDLMQLWEWNGDAPVALEKYVHELIDEQTQIQPSAPALSAWDGNITYDELSKLSDTLSDHLIDLGIESDTFVPLCFEKSMWTTVAILGVLKAGAAFALLDPSLPESRLKSIVHQLQADVMLSSTANLDLGSRLCKTVVQVCADSIRHSTSSTIQRQRQHSPNSPMFVIFTSGSTGTPKGVILTHTNIASGLKYQAQLLGFKSNSRVFDFASYAFDIAVHNIFATLSTGGCLCIPSNEDRQGNIEQSMAAMRVTVANLTPSVSRLIKPENVTSLKTLILAGESVSSDDVQPWWGKVDIVNAYGPAECNISTVNAGASSVDASIGIGKGAGLITWVVDPENHNRLLPPGCIGELLLEGPLVGQGYLNDTEMTAASYIDRPAWSQLGSTNGQEQSGRVYKTGDLVQYTKDGSLKFIGRKDGQVKIRGQRIELEEVQHFVQQSIPEAYQVAAEVIVPRGDNASPMLVAFLQIEGRVSQAGKTEVLGLSTHVEAYLTAHLPSYMVPTVFFAVKHLPIGKTGKLDRKRLREIGCSFSTQELARARTVVRGTKRQPTSNLQTQMQKIWSRILNIDAVSIGLDDSFFQLGGDSIAAIKVVGEARKAGLELTVANIFHHPALHQVAASAQSLKTQNSEFIPPFSLLGDNINVASLRQQISSQYQLGPVQDAYPCTPLQEGLLSLSTKHQGGYMLQVPLQISSHVDVKRFRNAWDQVAREMPILRTRIVQHDDLGLLQVVQDEGIRWTEANSVNECIDTNTEQPMGLGQPLVRYTLVKDDSGAVKWFILALHHALYDGWSLPIIINTVNQLYHGKSIERGSQFQAMIKYIASLDSDSVAAYWLHAFADYDSVPYPTLPISVDQPKADSFMQHEFSYPQEVLQDVTTPILIRAAWALVVGKTINSNDVVYGVTVSGRNAPIPGIESIAGPVFATVPLRVKLASDCNMLEYLKAVQRQATEMIPFEQAGLQHIAKLSSESQSACKFQTLLVIQPPETGRTDDILGKWHVNENYLQYFNPYSLMVEVHLGPGSLNARASFDSRVIKPYVVQRLLRQLDHVLQQFNRPSIDKTLADIRIMTPSDLEQIWSWNANVPPSYNECAHVVIEDRARANPNAAAIHAWDGELTYGNLNQLGHNLASHLVGQGVTPGMVIPLCFEKSVWTPVAMLAVLKAGAAFVLLETSLPMQRLQKIIRKVNPILILSSYSNQALGLQLSNLVIQVGPDSDCLLPPTINAELPPPVPSAAMFVVFTSGSTGEPKGATISHRNLCTGLNHQSGLLGITENSRIFDFASYAFDVACHNVFAALLNGGCLCIPSDEDRSSNLTTTMAAMRATVVSLTPSVARIIDPSMVPNLETIILLGEAVSVDDAARWWGKARVINVYGPAECLFCTVNYDAPSPEAATSIGKGVGLLTWVVDPEDHNTLLPPGYIGELLVEGPLVGLGYLNEPERTAEVFVNDPVWLLQGDLHNKGRRGQVYKTGDLVFYNEDGSLVYVGRKDTQVKIHGQRVELGEVEYCVQQCIPDTSQVVAEVLTPVGESSSSILVAFLHPNNSQTDSEHMKSTEMAIVPNSSKIIFQLMEHLPSYMIPAAFLTIRNMPITPTGKTDRRQLREMATSFFSNEAENLFEEPKGSLHETSYEEPILETEQPAYSLAQKLLSLSPSWMTSNIPRIKNDMNNDEIGFPDLPLQSYGLDSISIMSLTHFITHEFGVQVSLRLLIDKKTSIRKLARVIKSLQHGESSENFTKEPPVDGPVVLDLKSKIDRFDSEIMATQHDLILQADAASEAFTNDMTLNQSRSLTVLLTGASGFIGTQILRQLLQHDQVQQVIAIVRGETLDTASARVIGAAKKAQWCTKAHEHKLRVWKGDLSLPQLGLDQTHWADLIGGKTVVDVIIHNGATVHWVKSYDELEAVNVGSTMELLKLAVMRPHVRFVYVTGGLQDLSPDDREEDIIVKLSSPGTLGYSQTKFVAEAVVKRASNGRAPGLGAISIVRPGLVVGTPTEGVANADDYLWRLVAASIKAGSYDTDSADEWLSVSDVATVASITVNTGLGIGSKRLAGVQQIEDGMTKEELWATLKDIGYDLNGISSSKWLAAINHDMEAEKEMHPLWPVAHVFRGEHIPSTERLSRTEFKLNTSLNLKEAVIKSAQFLSKVGFLPLPAKARRDGEIGDNMGAFSRSGL